MQFTESQLSEEGGHFEYNSNKHGYLNLYIRRRRVGDSIGKEVEVDLDPNTLLLGHSVIDLTTNKIRCLSGNGSEQSLREAMGFSKVNSRIKFTESQLSEEGGLFEWTNNHGYLKAFIRRRRVGDSVGKEVEVDLDPNTLLLGYTVIDLTTNKIRCLSGGKSHASLREAMGFSKVNNGIQFTESQLSEEGGRFERNSSKEGYLNLYIRRSRVGDFVGKVVVVRMNENSM
jgi:uncharacterized protein YlbG (UPF0298 family)